MPRRKPENYIDNKKFLEEMLKYKKEVRAAKREKREKPGVNDYIGKCFLDIATNLARKPNFVNYVFKEEMIGDGIENCLMYVDNFDPKKSKNPFAFFTQIIFYSFLRRIQKEKKHLYTKMSYFKNMDHKKEFVSWAMEKNAVNLDGNDPYMEFFNLSENDLKKFEKGLVERKKREKKNTEDGELFE
jgi:hypothetical protein